MADAQQQLSEALQSASVFRQDAETTRSQLARVQSALDTVSAAAQSRAGWDSGLQQVLVFGGIAGSPVLGVAGRTATHHK